MLRFPFSLPFIAMCAISECRFSSFSARCIPLSQWEYFSPPLRSEEDSFRVHKSNDFLLTDRDAFEMIYWYYMHGAGGRREWERSGSKQPSRGGVCALDGGNLSERKQKKTSEKVKTRWMRRRKKSFLDPLSHPASFPAKFFSFDFHPILLNVFGSSDEQMKEKHVSGQTKRDHVRAKRLSKYLMTRGGWEWKTKTKCRGEEWKLKKNFHVKFKTGEEKAFSAVDSFWWTLSSC